MTFLNQNRRFGIEKSSGARAHLTVFLILLQNDLLTALYGVRNLVQQVPSGFTGQALKRPGGISGLDCQLPAAVGGLLRGFRIGSPQLKGRIRRQQRIDRQSVKAADH